MPDTTKTRGRKSRYDFARRRAGDVITLPDEKSRMMYLSAFINWKRGRPGTLKASSRKVENWYEVRFEGISPFEAAAAALEAQGDI